MPKSLMKASLTFFLILSLSLPCLGRYYDAGIGRFLIPDPHADNYPSISPYHYCLNDPINKIDPNGLDTYNVDENGDVTVQEGHWWNPWSWKHGVFSDNVTMNGETYKMSDVSVVTQNYIGMKLTDPASLDAVSPVSLLNDPIFIGLSIGTTSLVGASKSALNIADDAFVHVTTKNGSIAILESGLNPKISGHVTKWKYVKNVKNPVEFNTKLYSQKLWSNTAGKFNSGAHILKINSSVKPTYFSPFTNNVNGIPQWVFNNNVPASQINLIKVVK